jgi:hypothetical protein
LADGQCSFGSVEISLPTRTSAKLWGEDWLFDYEQADCATTFPAQLIGPLPNCPLGTIEIVTGDGFTLVRAVGHGHHFVGGEAYDGLARSTLSSGFGLPVDFVLIPEPSTGMLLGIGLGAIWCPAIRRRRGVSRGGPLQQRATLCGKAEGPGAVPGPS